MERREPPPTKEGWFVLHDFRTIDWDRWRSAPTDRRERALEEGRQYMEAQAARATGSFVAFSVIGHKADFGFIHFRESSHDIDTAERAFEQTALAEFTTQPASFVSVTEVSGYTTSAFFEEDETVADPGLRRYMEMRLHPTIPKAEFFSFYPMSKRRDPEYNWYDLPFDERAEHMQAHGDIGREYAGKVTQVITSGIGFDDWEWGVTLFANEPAQIKRLLYEMRFDPSTSKFAEFGPFYVGHRLSPDSLERLLAGEPLGESGPDPSSMGDSEAPTESDFASTVAEYGIEAELDVDIPEGAHGVLIRSEAATETVAEAVDELRTNFDHYDSHIQTDVHGIDSGALVMSLWETERAASTAAGFLEELPDVIESVVGPVADGATESRTVAPSEDDIRGELADLDIYAGRPHGEDVYAMVLYSTADIDELRPQVDRLRDGFERYETHVRTTVYDGRETDRRAIVSLWSERDAADTAGEYLSELPDIVARAGDESGFGTMGMFYTVKPEYRADFVEKFQTVGDMIDEIDGHLETDLMVNIDDENDMFIASQWRSREDAMEFFRADAFSETVQWGRDILADRPRHVFLA